MKSYLIILSAWARGVMVSTGAVAARFGRVLFGGKKKVRAFGNAIVLVYPNPPAGALVSTQEHPVQDFLWSDFTAKPRHEYVYRVVPVRGRPKSLSTRRAGRGRRGDRVRHGPDRGRLLQPGRDRQPGVRTVSLTA